MFLGHFTPKPFAFVGSSIPGLIAIRWTTGGMTGKEEKEKKRRKKERRKLASASRTRRYAVCPIAFYWQTDMSTREMTYSRRFIISSVSNASSVPARDATRPHIKTAALYPVRQQRRCDDIVMRCTDAVSAVY